MKDVVLITTGSPATNPRLVKEADALSEAGHRVHVLYSHVVDWALPLDADILRRAQWTATLIGGSPHQNRLTHVLSSAAFRIIRNFRMSTSRSWWFSRTSPLLARAARSRRADLYIAHNLGALSAALSAAKHHGTLAAFDAEDYHSGEHPEGAEQRLTQEVENRLIPQCDAAWAASPLIAQAYGERFPQVDFTVIDNVFPPTLQPKWKELPASPLRFVWFSQTIGPDRGLEPILTALASLPKGSWALTLVGRTSSDFQPTLDAIHRDHLGSVKIMAPIPEPDLFDILSSHHVGLATEMGVPENRDLCRTNKLFSYILAGCHMAMTDTRAQVDFLKSFPGTGTLLPLQDTACWAGILKGLMTDETQLEAGRHHNWTLGQHRLNWQEEKVKLLQRVDSLWASSNPAAG